jgi:hypothetical protein
MLLHSFFALGRFTMQVRYCVKDAPFIENVKIILAKHQSPDFVVETSQDTILSFVFPTFRRFAWIDKLIVVSCRMWPLQPLPKMHLIYDITHFYVFHNTCNVCFQRKHSQNSSLNPGLFWKKYELGAWTSSSTGT